jgi:hypothetical protein
LKEAWERYQVAAAFAEAGEEKTARHFLEEDVNEQPSAETKDRSSRVAGDGLLKPSTAEG